MQYELWFDRMEASLSKGALVKVWTLAKPVKIQFWKQLLEFTTGRKPQQKVGDVKSIRAIGDAFVKGNLSRGRPARDLRFPVDWERDGHYAVVCALGRWVMTVRPWGFQAVPDMDELREGVQLTVPVAVLQALNQRRASPGMFSTGSDDMPSLPGLTTLATAAPSKKLAPAVDLEEERARKRRRGGELAEKQVATDEGSVQPPHDGHQVAVQSAVQTSHEDVPPVQDAAHGAGNGAQDSAARFEPEADGEDLDASQIFVTRKYCPGQVSMVKRPAESTTLLSRRSVTLTSARIRTPGGIHVPRAGWAHL